MPPLVKLACGTYLASRLLEMELKLEVGMTPLGKQWFHGVPCGQNAVGPWRPAAKGMGLLDRAPSAEKLPILWSSLKTGVLAVCAVLLRRPW
jgi:hypothetical protein